MRLLELTEYEPHRWSAPLDASLWQALDRARVEVRAAAGADSGYVLTPTSYVGAVNVGDLSVVIRPKIPIDRVMFLMTYALAPRHWWQDWVELARHDDILEAIAMSFALRTRQAIRRGLLRDYRREEDALTTVRGRIRFGDQMGRRFGIPLPIEVAYDEYTEDIAKNRLLKTAIHRLGHAFIRSAATKQQVRRLWPAFDMVNLGQYSRGATPDVTYTRLDEHYRPAVELARLIIANSTLELSGGKVAGAALLIDMNLVFEKFLYVALGEALGLSATQWKHEARLTLDAGRRIRMYPDLSWWPAGGALPRFVGDAKYKRLSHQGFQHADIYQMLAYCTAANLPSGLLIYAQGEDEPVRHKINHAGKTIEVASLDLQGQPEHILAEVRQLAELVKAHASAPLPNE